MHVCVFNEKIKAKSAADAEVMLSFWGKGSWDRIYSYKTKKQKHPKEIVTVSTYYPMEMTFDQDA